LVSAATGARAATGAQPQNQLRLKKVLRFFANRDCDQALRRSSLVLQLTGGVEAFMSKGEKDGEEPKVVSLVRGVVHLEVLRRLRRIMAELHRDPVLDAAAATGVLWGAASDLFSAWICTR